MRVLRDSAVIAALAGAGIWTDERPGWPSWIAFSVAVALFLVVVCAKAEDYWRTRDRAGREGLVSGSGRKSPRSLTTHTPSTPPPGAPRHVRLLRVPDCEQLDWLRAWDSTNQTKGDS